MLFDVVPSGGVVAVRSARGIKNSWLSWMVSQGAHFQRRNSLPFWPASQYSVYITAVVLNLCYSDGFELQLPETPVSTDGGEGFWELQSKTPE